MTLECSTLVLDLDGTISDPSLGISRCMNHALQIHGFNAVSSKDIAGEMGPPLDEMFLKLAPDVSTDEFLHTQMRKDADGLTTAAEQSAKRANGENLSKSQQRQLQETMSGLGAMPDKAGASLWTCSSALSSAAFRR